MLRNQYQSNIHRYKNQSLPPHSQYLNNPFYLTQSGTPLTPPPPFQVSPAFQIPPLPNHSQPFNASINNDMTYFDKSKTFEGKLNKRGKINKAWKERWFVLDEYEQKMEYYPNKQDAINHTHLCGTIDISMVEKIEMISNIDQIKLSETQLLKQNQTILSKFILTNEKAKSNQSYSFQLVMKSRTYIFSATDSKSYISWLHELCRVIYGGIVHEGLLKKLGYRNKSWKQRYFTLNKYKQMKYYIDKSRKDFLGLIDLNLCILITNGKAYGANLKYTIEIQTPNRTWIICAPDKDTKYEWEKMIKNVRWEKLNDQQTNHLIQQNLWKHHEEDLKAIQKSGKGNNLLGSPPQHINRAMSGAGGSDKKGAPLSDMKGAMGMSYNGRGFGGGMGMGMGMNPNMMGLPPNAMSNNGKTMDEQMLQMQQQMMMNNGLLAQHIMAMQQTMHQNMGGFMPGPMMNGGNGMGQNANNNGGSGMNGFGGNNGMNNGNGMKINNKKANNPHLGVGSMFDNAMLASSAPNAKGGKKGNPLSNSSENFNHFGNYSNNNQQKAKQKMPDMNAMYQQQQNSVLESDDEDQKIHEGNNVMKPDNDNVNGNAMGGNGNLKVQKILDFWDASLVGQNQCIMMEGQNRIGRTLMINDRRWYNLFSTIITERQVQYHWKIKINEYNRDWVMIIGIMDTCYIDEYVQYNNNDSNKNYFAKSKYGYGIDASGNLQNGGKNGGKYCQEFKNGDIVDVYFDMKQFVLWYGLNGKEYGVACKVHESFYKCCVAMFGPKHAVELISCDTYFYPNK